MVEEGVGGTHRLKSKSHQDPCVWAAGIVNNHPAARLVKGTFKMELQHVSDRKTYLTTSNTHANVSRI